MENNSEEFLLNIKSKKFFGLLLFVIAVLFVFCGYFYWQNVSLQQELKEVVSQAEIKSMDQNKDLSYYKEFYDECTQDRAHIRSQVTKPYSFEEFGVEVPDLESVEFSVYEYGYKGGKVVQHTASVDVEEENYYVNVWYSPDSDFKCLAENRLEDLQDKFGQYYPDFPIFTGYENYGNPVWLDTILLNSDAKRVVINKQEMIYNYQASPRLIGAVSLDFYSFVSPLGTDIFVEVGTTVNSELEQNLADTEKSVAVQDAEKRLLEFAQQVKIY